MDADMISAGYVTTMARYNAWQNGNVAAVLDRMSEADITAGRGAFFGSILGTLNHLLWADQFWMSRLDGWTRPPGGITESVTLTPSSAAWTGERQSIDARLIEWGDRLRPDALSGDLSWYSGVMGATVSKPIALCVMHMFNHQTHHRGQVHAMLTAAGHDPGATDLPFAPEGALG